MLDGVEVAERIGVVQRSMLAKPLDVIAALDVMAQRLGGVAAGEELAVPIEVDPPGVAAALGEQLELPGPWMIAPDALLKLDAANVGRHRAALRPVEPAVRS